jgi:hypothetical protein
MYALLRPSRTHPLVLTHTRTSATVLSLLLTHSYDPRALTHSYSHTHALQRRSCPSYLRTPTTLAHSPTRTHTHTHFSDGLVPPTYAHLRPSRTHPLTLTLTPTLTPATVLFLLQLVGGVAYNRFVRGEKGVNQIPGHEFWSFVVSRVASAPDSVAALVSSIRKGRRHGADTPVQMARLNQHTIDDMGKFRLLSPKLLAFFFCSRHFSHA